MQTRSKLYRIYALEDGTVVRHKDLHVTDDASAIRYVRTLRRECDRELWDMSSAPARQVLVSNREGAASEPARSASATDQA